MPKSHVRTDERPSNSLSLRCTTTKTSWTTSSRWLSAMPSRRAFRQTKAKCSSYTPAKDGGMADGGGRTAGNGRLIERVRG